jgi:uncharacterized membrane protein (UPF0127 family)
MRYVRVVNQTTGRVLAQRAGVADRLWTRFLGLQGRRHLPAGAGLLLLPCASIHMLFMLMRIDAIFATREGCVLRVGHRLRPWTIGPVVPGALYCVELPAGAAQDTVAGHIITLEQA